MAETAPWDTPAPQESERSPWDEPAEKPGFLADVKSGKYGGAAAAIYAQITGPSWVTKATEESQRNWEAFTKGGVPGMLRDMESAQELAEGFQPAPLKGIKPVAAVKAVAPVLQEFNDTVMAPAAARLDAFARTGSPDGVKLEMPIADTKPEPPLTPPRGPGLDRPLRRTEAAQTGDPVIDNVLNHPVTNTIIDRPIIDRSHDVPYMAGGSVPLENPTVYIDKHVPREQTVGGITFDPADPWTVHENVEQTVMDTLIKNGMDASQAYRTAHFGWAEPAEQAWYRAHGIDQVAAEAEQAKWLPRIQHEPPVDIPRDLYDKPYPDSQPGRAHDEAIAETQPTPGEMSLARDIIRNAPELQPRSAEPMLQQARNLGVIGPPKELPVDEKPAVAAQRAIPAARTPDDKLTMTPNGESLPAWEARFKDWVSRVKEPEDVKPFIEQAAQENNNFPEARAGQIAPEHVDILAKAAGISANKIDVAELSSKLNNPDKVRMAKQLLDTALQDFKSARDLVEGDASTENIGKMLEAQMRRDYAVEYVVGLRSEWARTGHSLRDLLETVKGAEDAEKPGREQIINDLLSSKGRTPKDMADMARDMRGLDDEAMAKTLTNMRGKGPHWLHWGISQALISGVITHTYYTFTNTMFMELERVIAPGISAIFDRIRGNPDPILFGEVGAAQRAIISSIPQAFDAAKQAFKTGLRVPLPNELELLAKEAKGPKAAEKAMVPYTSGQPVDWGIFRRIASDETLAKVERGVGVFGRSANFQHTFFKNLSFHASMDAQAYHAAAREGFSPRTQDFADRQAFWKANPTDAMVEKGVQDGYSGTFMQQLGENTAAFSRLVRNTPLKWVFFFTHIPMNIARAGIEYTMPFLGKEMRANMFGENGASAQNLAFAKWTLGSTFAGYAIYKGMMDEATGAYPTDPDEQRRWKMEGRQQNSVQAFGQWWSLERLGPVGIAFKLGADIGYIARSWDHEDKETGENITNAVGHLAIAFANAYGTEAGFQGVSNLMDLLQGKHTPAEWAAYQGASMLQPVSMLSQAASFMDPDMRKAEGFFDAVKMRLPFLRQTLEPKLDPIFGDPMPNPGYLTIERHVPAADPIKLEMEKVGYFPTYPAKHIGGVRLTPEQYHRYQATAGPLVHEALSGIVDQPGWDELPAGERRKYMESTVKSMRKVAADAIQAENPEIIEAGIKRQLKFLETGSKKLAKQPQ